MLKGMALTCPVDLDTRRLRDEIQSIYAREAGLDNVEVRIGDAMSLPLEDASADVVISNGVLNLTPDKSVAYREVYRVLRPGGRFL